MTVALVRIGDGATFQPFRTAGVGKHIPVRASRIAWRSEPPGRVGTALASSRSRASYTKPSSSWRERP